MPLLRILPLFCAITALVSLALLSLALPAMAQDQINFGNDDGEWALDEECDDRRFFGTGMALGLSWEYVGQDATDCKAAFDAGTIQLWDVTAAKAATVCAAIDFGDDSGEYPQDGECDDLRFEGPAVARLLDPANVAGDASDCARMCVFGIIALRDY